MYELNICKVPGCNKAAHSVIDADGNILEERSFCMDHEPDVPAVKKMLRNYILRHDKIVGLTACGLDFSDIDMSKKRFYGCNMQHCTISNVHGSEIRMRMCMFDYSTFSDCDFIKSNIQFTSFCGSKFVHILFTGSDLIHNNFNGTQAYQCSFDDSDLYNSRFIKSTLVNTSMTNCNLKKTVFYESSRQDVSFKLSNTREALIDRNKGGLMGDISADFSDDDQD